MEDKSEVVAEGVGEKLANKEEFQFNAERKVKQCDEAKEKTDLEVEVKTKSMEKEIPINKEDSDVKDDKAEGKEKFEGASILDSDEKDEGKKDKKEKEKKHKKDHEGESSRKGTDREEEDLKKNEKKKDEEKNHKKEENKEKNSEDDSRKSGFNTNELTAREITLDGNEDEKISGNAGSGEHKEVKEGKDKKDKEKKKNKDNDKKRKVDQDKQKGKGNDRLKQKLEKINSKIERLLEKKADILRMIKETEDGNHVLSEISDDLEKKTEDKQ